MTRGGFTMAYSPSSDHHQSIQTVSCETDSNPYWRDCGGGFVFSSVLHGIAGLRKRTNRGPFTEILGMIETGGGSRGRVLQLHPRMSPPKIFPLTIHFDHG